MIEELNKTVTDGYILRQGFIVRDGFIFVLGEKPAVYDTLLIRSPADAIGPIRHAYSSRSIEDHIQMINQYKLEKAKIICRDLTFITQCPSLTEISVYPDDFGFDGFDYSPLYSMPNLKSVCCRTQYGIKEQYKTNIDYSHICGVKEISVAGPGHTGYEMVPSLETLWISNCKKHKDLSNISCSAQLKDLTMLQCSIQTLKGIDSFPALESLALFHNRSLSDISPLASNASSMKILAIEGCPKITDFSVLAELINLEHLQLYGANTLPNLNFLHRMIKLKTFTFTMNVQDGDLSNCLQVPYASCKNRKHFNLKDSQLPKQLTK